MPAPTPPDPSDSTVRTIVGILVTIGMVVIPFLLREEPKPPTLPTYQPPKLPPTFAAKKLEELLKQAERNAPSDPGGLIEFTLPLDASPEKQLADALTRRAKRPTPGQAPIPLEASDQDIRVDALLK